MTTKRDPIPLVGEQLVEFLLHAPLNSLATYRVRVIHRPFLTRESWTNLVVKRVPP